MASEYLKWKYRDVKPDEPIVLTKEQKRKNWWHYHKWHVVIGIVLAAIAIDLICNALGVGKTFPDYTCAYVGETAIPDDAAKAIGEALASFGEDLNGDGKVVFNIQQYVSGEGMGGESAEYNYASTMRLMADLEYAESYFFLLDDPEDFQSKYVVLRKLDGSLPIEGDKDYDSMALPWSSCPALASLDLGDFNEEILGQTISGSVADVVEGLYIARRGFWTDKTSENAEGCDALWDVITEGAIK